MNKINKNASPANKGSARNKPKAKKKKEGADLDCNGILEEVARHSRGKSSSLVTAGKSVAGRGDAGLLNGRLFPSDDGTSSKKHVSTSKSSGGCDASSSAVVDESLPHHCTYCSVQFLTRAELMAHCRSQEHQTAIMSDEGRKWVFRLPPRGLTNSEFKLCSNLGKDGLGRCRFGDQCIGAHSGAELAEWQQRFEYRAMKLQEAKDKQLHGGSYADQLLERLSNAQSQHSIVTFEVSAV